MDLTKLSEDELTAHLNDILNEQERRKRLSLIPDQVAKLAAAFKADGGDAALLTAAVNGG